MKNKYDRLPHAGDIEREPGTEIVYLSPKPVPTGVLPFSSRQLHRYANEVFLDFAISRGSFEFMTRAGIGAVMFLLIFLFFTTGLGSWIRRDVEPFWSSWLDFFTSIAVWGFVGALATLYLFVFFFAIRQVSNQPPIRFNRQRREVVFVPKKGMPPRYVPWEEVIASVSVSKLITQYAVIPEFKLIIGLRDKNGDVLWVSVPSENLNQAIAEWEAIRVYMEEGVQALPMGQSDEFEAGSVAYFHMCRQGYRSHHSFLRYVWGFLTVQFFSGWTIPCYIAAWINNRPKAGFPKEVLDWSLSRPIEEHAVPSDELLKESAEIRKAFAKGQNLLDYFKVKFSEPAQEPTVDAS
ncbi:MULTISPECIES: DUF6708 domain-containing protein [unclassified Pseudomonas]|uniref:DUF6708 domain-containing protein n=1 Tax=unclassified Pseudomonas TaxID=196821 RepID=UPI001CC0F826|nr:MULTISPECIES: DUF6708 domain-containing protein [unclassified Pseudomonas]